MPETIKLTGSTLAASIPGVDIAITAPGLQGQLVCTTETEAALVRGDAEAAPSGVDRALDDAELRLSHSLQIDAPTPSVDSTGGARGEGGLGEDEVRLDLTGDSADTLFAIYQDEEGVISLHAPLPTDARPGLVRNGENTTTIVIKLRRAEPPPAAGETRGLLGNLAGKIIKLVLKKVLGVVVEYGEYKLVQAWENKHREHQGFHRGSPEQFLAAVPTPAEASDLKKLAGKRSLLFIHGTTSSTSGAFNLLGNFPEFAKKLWAGYGNRVIGFNHHTLSKSVAANVVDFYRDLPPSPDIYEFDVIVHSRGGLVARALTEASDELVRKFANIDPSWAKPADRRIRLRRIVFVGTPNNGTPAADPDNIPQVLNWLANLAEHIPVAAVAVPLSAVFAIMAFLVESGFKALPGLVDQSSDANGDNGVLLTNLNPLGADYIKRAECYSITAEFTPAFGPLLSAAAAFGIKQLFRQQNNDLIVPTDGVAAIGEAKFTTPAKSYSPADGFQVHHTCYFGRQETWDYIASQLLKK